MKSEQADIIQRARAGDLEAFRLIHDHYGRRILNFIYRMVGSREDAEDLTQNVFLVAFHELRNLQDLERFESWLYRIARNEVYQTFRRKRSEPASFEPASADGGASAIETADLRPTPQDNVLHGELGTEIQRALRSLPPKLREVFILAVVHEKSYAEIARIVGRSLMSVKTDIFRARSSTRKALGRYMEARQ